MTKEQKIIRAKVGLLELAKQLGNVSQACQALRQGEIDRRLIKRRKPIQLRTPSVRSSSSYYSFCFVGICHLKVIPLEF
jgi:hypothetical protein